MEGITGMNPVIFKRGAKPGLGMDKWGTGAKLP